MLSCVALVSMFADTMILPAIPYLIESFKISYSTSSWILASFLITAAVMTPIAGKLSDMRCHSIKTKLSLTSLLSRSLSIDYPAFSNNKVKIPSSSSTLIMSILNVIVGSGITFTK
jgi:MFS family permease